VATVYNKQNCSYHPFLLKDPSFRAGYIAFRFLDFVLCVHAVLHRELIFLPSMHLGLSGFNEFKNKRPRLLKPSEISELVVDTDSNEASVSSNITSDSVSGFSEPQPYHQTASSHEPSSTISSSASDEEDAAESGLGEHIQQAVTLQWTRPSCPQSRVAHTFTGVPRGKKDKEASHK